MTEMRGLVGPVTRSPPSEQASESADRRRPAPTRRPFDRVETPRRIVQRRAPSLDFRRTVLDGLPQTRDFSGLLVVLRGPNRELPIAVFEDPVQVLVSCRELAELRVSNGELPIATVENGPLALDVRSELVELRVTDGELPIATVENCPLALDVRCE